MYYIYKLLGTRPRFSGVEFASRDSVMARVSTIEQHNYLMYLNEFKFKKKSSGTVLEKHLLSEKKYKV